ncbi:hypothetical protein EYZ11_003623 [Aspergillus tanneri]|nr:hypothetical protein EYZ11_003623 [Aspergillus tanneri]
MMLGDNLQPAALTQIFEDVICDNYFAGHSPSPASNPSPLLIRQLANPSPLFAALVCTVLYGLLAERIGRNRVLILSGAGVLAALSWVLAVCYWRFANIRWVWLSGALFFIGGGDAVSSSVVHVMVTDATDPAEHVQLFLFFHTADVVSGPAVSAALMEKGYTWTVLLLAEMALFPAHFYLRYSFQKH